MPLEETYKLGHLKDDHSADELTTCKQCKWWCHRPSESQMQANPRLQILKNERIGECRSAEPRMAGMAGDGQHRCLGVWPVTFENDWCARFEARKGLGGLAAKMKG